MATTSAMLLADEGFLNTLRRSLAIRYILTPGNPSDMQYLIVEILGATGISGQPSSTDILFRFKSGIHLHDDFKPSSLEFDSERRYDQVMQRLQAMMEDWESKAPTHPWWGDWLQSKPFVGVFLLGNGIRREVGADNPNFLFYHGVLAQQIAQHANYLEEVSQHERSLAITQQRDAFKVLARRFGAFAAQAQHAHVAQTIGTTDKLYQL